MKDAVGIRAYRQIESEKVDLSGREKNRVAQLLNDRRGPILALAEWLVDDKSLTPAEGMWKLYDVSVLSESEKAWRVETGTDQDWVPKSQSELFERADGAGEIDSPASSLADFGGSQ